MAPNGAQPVAIVQITLDQHGKIGCTYQGPGRDVFNMMLARASQDMLPKFLEQEENKVVEAPAGILLAQRH